MNYQLTHLDTLESEAVHVIREVVAECERPALLFSGGKDSAVLLHLATKACWPQKVPFPVVHVDTGHNFPEVLAFRDARVRELGVELIVSSVQEAIDLGEVVEDQSPRRVAQPAADRRVAEDDRRAPLRRDLRRRTAR